MCTLGPYLVINNSIVGMGFTYQMLQFQEERMACGALTITPLEKVFFTLCVLILQKIFSFDDTFISKFYTCFFLLNND